MKYTFLIFISFCLHQNSFSNECSPANDVSRVTVAGGSITEIMYMIDAEDSIIAVDLTSNFPERARSHPQIGYVRALSAEGRTFTWPLYVLFPSPAEIPFATIVLLVFFPICIILVPVSAC